MKILLGQYNSQGDEKGEGKSLLKSNCRASTNTWRTTWKSGLQGFQCHCKRFSLAAKRLIMRCLNIVDTARHQAHVLYTLAYFPYSFTKVPIIVLFSILAP